ncbi:MAG: mechanosensitive ion channel family protein [Austwickia sp.]|nr:mechanosensitive ion channel family protein [Austwickia sp.]
MAFAVPALTWSDAWDWFVGVPLAIVLILFTAAVTRWLVHRGIDAFVTSAINRRAAEAPQSREVRTDQLPLVRRQARRAGRWLNRSGLIDQERQDRRISTLGSVLRSCASVVIWSVAVLLVLDQLRINLAPLLASAGVGGIAVAFGAQSLVKDFLSGLFMMFEDQYGVGDVIDVGEATGTVEEVSLRVTRLRDANGVVWYVRNGEIVRIANRSQGWSTAMVDVPIAASEDVENAQAVLRETLAEMDGDAQWSGILLEEPRVLGVETVTGGSVTLRVLAKCAPNEHFSVQREIRERAIVAFHRAGIKAPTPMLGSSGGPPAATT